MRIWGFALDHLVIRQYGFQREASEQVSTNANPREQVGNNSLFKIVSIFFTTQSSIACLCFLSSLPTLCKRQRWRCAAIVVRVSKDRWTDSIPVNRDRQPSGNQGEMEARGTWAQSHNAQHPFSRAFPPQLNPPLGPKLPRNLRVAAWTLLSSHNY